MSDRRTIETELNELNSSLAQHAAQVPYAVPQGYFEGLAEQALMRIRRDEVVQELAAAAPTLVDQPRKMPYALPTGYFEQVPIPAAQAAPVVSLFRRTWISYASAVAAILIGVLVWLNQDTNTADGSAASTVVTQYQDEIKELNEEEKNLLQDFMEAGLTGQETAKLETGSPLQTSLLTDISEQELTDFLEQSEPLTSSTQPND